MILLKGIDLVFWWEDLLKGFDCVSGGKETLFNRYYLGEPRLKILTLFSGMKSTLLKVMDLVFWRQRDPA